MYITLCDKLPRLVASGLIRGGGVGRAIFGSMNPVSSCSLISVSLLAKPFDEGERGE